MSSNLATLNILGQIHKKDCISGMNAMPEGSVDLVFADPPFNIGYDYDVYHDKKEYKLYLDWSREWISAVNRVLKPDGTFWLAIGDEYAAELKVLSQELGFSMRSWVIWYYTFGVNCKNKFSRSHAHLFQFVKNPKKYTFRADERENRVPSARQLVYNDSRGNEVGRLADDTWILRPQNAVDSFTPNEDTWYFPRVAGTFKERAGFHGCQMPEQLLGRIIRACSFENEIVLDPFSGSATTLVVAKKLGRRFVGFEISDDYVSRGTNRLIDTRLGDPLEGADEPIMSAPATVLLTISKAKKSKRSNKKAITPPARPVDTNRLRIEKGLIESFKIVSQGFSLDRVVADPDLNAHLADKCNAIGLPGDIRSWNHLLFNLRKAGKFAPIETTKRTEISWKKCDDYLYASEIALANMLKQGCDSLDEILCDPLLAAQFDNEASRFAPGHSSLEYRWAALKLRKEAKSARSRAKSIHLVDVNRFAETTGNKFKLSKIPQSSGVYLICVPSEEKCIYAGEALNLRERFERQLGSSVIQAYNFTTDWTVSTYSTIGTTPELLAYQSRLISDHKPSLNFKELAAA